MREKSSALNKKRLTFGVILSIILFVVSLALFPDWGLDWRLILVLAGVVIYAIVEFLSNFRQAFYDDHASINTSVNQLKNSEQVPGQPLNQSGAGSAIVKDSRAGRDIIGAPNSEIQTGGVRIRTVEDYKSSNKNPKKSRIKR